MRSLIKFRFVVVIGLTLCSALLSGLLLRPGLTQSSSSPAATTPTAQLSWQPAEGTWQPVPSHREDRGAIKVVWLQGTPYEMGYQHGTLLHDEIASLGREKIEAIRFAARGLALSKLAMRRSFPGVIEECQGLTDATQDIGMTIDACMALAHGDVYQEFLLYLAPDVLFHDGCAGFVAIGDATKDGQVYHARTLDNNKKPISYWVDNPTVIVRQPNDGIPHIFLTIPGVVWPNSALNAEGVSISLDTAHPRRVEQISLTGASTVQLMAQIMKHASSYDEAKELMGTWVRARANLIMVAGGKSKQAGVFEVLGYELGIREISNNGVIYMTNHFLAPETVDKDPPPSSSSLSRYERLKQLMEPDSPDTLYGSFDPETMVKVLRDRVNPATQQTSPLSVFDDNVSVGGNGALRQEMFDNERLLFWVAGGHVPTPENPFACFSLGEMIGLPNAVPCPSSAIP